MKSNVPPIFSIYIKTLEVILIFDANVFSLSITNAQCSILDFVFDLKLR